MKTKIQVISENKLFVVLNGIQDIKQSFFVIDDYLLTKTPSHGDESLVFSYKDKFTFITSPNLVQVRNASGAILQSCCKSPWNHCIATSTKCQ